VRYAKNILETLGDTPLVRLNKVTAGSKALVLAKLEMFNPGGSIKDRIGIAMVEDAERKGLLKPGGTIVEPTSGNTGIGLALVAALRGYKMIFTVPDKQSREKINMLKAYGAKVVVTPTAVAPDHPDSYYKVAERLHKETPNSFLPYQYTNPQNPEAHYRTTGPEIWRDTDGKVTHLVSGMGTGGTISGVGRYLKERNRKVKVIGADPYGSILAELFYRKHGRAYPYKVEGIGEDFLPETTHFQYIDDILKVTDKEAFLTARRLAREEGIFAGGSAGAAVAVAVKVAKDLTKDDLVVVIVPESGDRYLNKVYNDEWMREMGFLEAEEGLPGILSRKGEAGMPAVLTIAAGDTLAGSLSHGDQKLLDIALALALRPKLLLLDEPTAGMHPEERRETMALVKRLWRDLGMTVVFVEHDMDIVFTVASTIRVLHHGELVAQGPPAEISTNRLVVEAYLGEGTL